MSQLHFPFHRPDDQMLFRPVFDALEANRCWFALARLHSIAAIWEALQARQHVSARLEVDRVIRPPPPPPVASPPRAKQR